MQHNRMLYAIQFIADDAGIVSIVRLRQFVQRHRPLPIRRLEVAPIYGGGFIFVPRYIRCRVACKVYEVINVEVFL